jgi:signal transduction histidine kinase/ligand-binding sensor domain-containing protein/CheY-like chemotaxis protein
MWFGSRDGLNRFDGYSFRTFRNDSEDPHSIGDNHINALAIDAKGVMWIGANMGMYSYDPACETFALAPFTRNMRITHIISGRANDIWLVCGGKLIYYDTALQHNHTYSLPDNSALTHLCITPLGQIWASSQNGMLYELSVSTATFSGYDVFAHSSDVKSRSINCIYPTATGDKLLIGTRTHGVKLFDINEGSYTDCFRYDPNHLELTVQDFLQVDARTVWVATESGLYFYDLITGRYTWMKKRPYDPYSLSTNIINSLYQDREKGIWLCTYAGGVNYYFPYQPFRKYYTYPGMNVLQGDLIHDICTDAYGNLWIATEDAGVNKYNPQTDAYANFQPLPGGKGLSHINIHGMVADGNRLWIATIAAVVDRMDIPSGQIIKRYRIGRAGALSQTLSVVNMKQLKDGSLLVSTSSGMFTYNKAKDCFDFMPEFPSCRIQSIYQDHAGTIWAGTVYYGVYYYDPQTGRHGRFEHDTIPNTSSNTVNDICEDARHNLWFATMEGIKKYDRQSETVNRFTIKNGLPVNICYRIIPDANGVLWITTSDGLVSLHPETEEISVYRRELGLITNQFNYNSGWKDPAGRLYFGGVTGLISFNPNEIKPASDKPAVRITAVTLLEASRASRQSPVRANPVRLPNDRSTLEIDFSAMSYFAPELIQYAYRMEGFDPDWIYPKQLHTAYYTRLPPGQYTFKVKAANVSGLWNDADPATLQIVVTPPWRASTQAKVVYLLLFAALCALAAAFFTQRNRKKVARSIKLLENEKEKELYQAKINFFITIAHEIRTPLTLIKSPLGKVMQNKGIPKEAKPYLSMVNKNTDRLLSLVNQLMDFRKTEIKGYSLNFMKTDIRELIRDISDRFKNTAEESGLSLELRIETLQQYAYIDREACTKIISNLLTNALKYARTFIRITLSFPEKEDTFVIDFGNDGESIAPEIKRRIFEPFFRAESSEHKPGTGLGLPLARSLAEMHRGTLDVLDSAGLTTFRLSIPVNQPNSILFNEDERITPPPSPSEYVMYVSRPTILLVEDNPEMRNYVGSELNVHYNVITAAHGKEALDKLAQYSCQLIVSDVMTPVMDGLALLKTIKTNLEYSHIPVILLTARNTIQSRLEGLELGADAYMEKPFSMDILLAQIANLLTNRENIRSSYSQSPVAHLKSMAYTKADENFLEKLNDIIYERISDINLDVDMIAERMNMSRPTLYRKIGVLSNLTPNELIRITRLKKAAQLISEGNLKIYEISERVGFNSQSYFSRTFAKQFGLSPSEYKNRLSQ